MANKANEVIKANEVEKDLVFNLEDFSSYGDEDISGLEVIDQTDIRMPKIKIVQITSQEFSQEKIPAGHFYNAVTKEHSEYLDCVFLTLGKTRVKWPEFFKRGDKPLCRSIDGLRGEGVGDGVCANCQYSSWNSLKADQTKPSCNMSYVWLGVTPNGSPFRFIAGGANVSITKDFINKVLPKLRMKNGKKLGIFAIKVRLSTEQKTNDRGTFYVLRYDITGSINPQNYNDLDAMSKSLKSLFSKAVAMEAENEDNFNEDSHSGQNDSSNDSQSNQEGSFF